MIRREQLRQGRSVSGRTLSQLAQSILWGRAEQSGPRCDGVALSPVRGPAIGTLFPASAGLLPACQAILHHVGDPRQRRVPRSARMHISHASVVLRAMMWWVSAFVGFVPGARESGVELLVEFRAGGEPAPDRGQIGLGRGGRRVDMVLCRHGDRSA